MSEPFIGEIRAFAGNFAPRGWAFCEGQPLAISQHSALFSILGTTYGGDGRETFELPDLRGRGLIGAGQGPGLSDIRLGQNTGQEETYIQQSNLPAITQSVSVNIGIPAATSSTNGGSAPSTASHFGPVTAGGRPAELYTTDAPDTTLAPFTAEGHTSTLGGARPMENRAPSLGISYIIALEGLFPSRS